MRKGMTGVEIAITASLIGIIAAISIPNYIQHKIRANLSRAYSDMRVIVSAVETYRMDQGKMLYPILPQGTLDPYYRLRRLAGAPKQYIERLPSDPFLPDDHDYENTNDSYDFLTREFDPEAFSVRGSFIESADYFARSVGPDGGYVPEPYFYSKAQNSLPNSNSNAQYSLPYTFNNAQYSLSNGLLSGGDLFYLNQNHPGE